MGVGETRNIDVFSNAVVVLDETFLNEVPEDKESFLNRVCAIAEVKITYNSNGNFTVEGSWRKIINLEEILKNSLRNWSGDSAEWTHCSDANYTPNDCAVNEGKCSEDKLFVRSSALENDSDASSLEKPSLGAYNTHVMRAGPKIGAEEIASLLRNESHSVNLMTEKNVKEAVEKENKNEIYVNITISTNNPISDKSPSRSENPISTNIDSTKDVKAKQKNLTRLSVNSKRSSSDLISKQLSEKDKRKLYEQQTPFKFFCTMCSFKSKRESHYKKHLQLHKQGSTKLFVCSQCGFRTIRMGHLRRHELQHALQAFRCSWCSYTTDNVTFLQRHQRIKHTSNPKQTASNGESYFRCSQCNYMTTQPHFLKRHLRVHGIGEDTNKNLTVSYQCEKCSYKTRRKEHFERHRRDVHSEARPFLCDACGKAFKRADALRQHRAARHHPFIVNEGKIAPGSNSSPSQFSLYCCPQCSKPCRSRTHLRDHMATHSDERSFLCEICGSSFKTRAVQRKHIATVHANPKAFPCIRCIRRFSTKYALLRHLKIHGVIKEDNAKATTKDESLVLSCIGTSKVADSGVSNLEESPRILIQNSQSLLSKDEESRRIERMAVVVDTQRQPSCSSIQTSSEVVTLIHGVKENKDSNAGEVALQIDDGMHSLSNGALTRTPAPSETTTALLYLTTDFTQY